MSDVQDSVLDLLDQRLLHAIQIRARAPWTSLAPILGADAVTLSRRWQRLHQAGVVYSTGYLSGPVGILALIEVQCAPQDSLAVAERIALEPSAHTIDLTAGGRDMVVTLATSDLARLSEWTLERILQIPGVNSMRTHIVSSVVADAGSWRLRALTEPEARAVEALPVSAPVRAPFLTADEQATLLDALARDGRIPARELGDLAGIAPRKAREAVAWMHAEHRLVLRVDVARARTPWPICAWYFLRVPAARALEVGEQLGRLAEVRLVAAVVGEYNLIVAVWLRTLSDVSRLEATIEDRLATTNIADRSVVLRTVKHLGHLLTPHGYATGATVPMRAY